jgi:hypothetical protein
MSTKTHGQGWHPVRNVNYENSARKFQNENNPSLANLQARREFIPLGTLNLLLAVVGPERSQELITFTSPASQRLCGN